MNTQYERGHYIAIFIVGVIFCGVGVIIVKSRMDHIVRVPKSDVEIIAQNQRDLDVLDEIVGAVNPLNVPTPTEKLKVDREPTRKSGQELLTERTKFFQKIWILLGRHRTEKGYPQIDFVHGIKKVIIVMPVRTKTGTQVDWTKKKLSCFLGDVYLGKTEWKAIWHYDISNNLVQSFKDSTKEKGYELPTRTGELRARVAHAMAMILAGEHFNLELPNEIYGQIGTGGVIDHE